MMNLLHPTQLEQVNEPDLRRLLALRRQQLGTLEGLFIVEPGDSMADLETAIGCTFQLWDDDPYSLTFEVLEDHGFCYEMVFIFNDGGGETVLFIPKQEGIDADLLSLCETHAIPAVISL